MARSKPFVGRTSKSTPAVMRARRCCG
jgi:hypothetical protein